MIGRMQVSKLTFGRPVSLRQSNRHRHTLHDRIPARVDIVLQCSYFSRVSKSNWKRCVYRSYTFQLTSYNVRTAAWSAADCVGTNSILCAGGWTRVCSFSEL